MANTALAAMVHFPHIFPIFTFGGGVKHTFSALSVEKPLFRACTTLRQYSHYAQPIIEDSLKMCKSVKSRCSNCEV